MSKASREALRRATSRASRVTQRRCGGNRAFLAVLSFLVPLLGFVAGVILLTKSGAQDRETGKLCVVLAFVGLFVTGLLWGLFATTILVSI